MNYLFIIIILLSLISLVYCINLSINTYNSIPNYCPRDYCGNGKCLNSGSLKNCTNCPQDCCPTCLLSNTTGCNLHLQCGTDNTSTFNDNNCYCLKRDDGKGGFCATFPSLYCSDYPLCDINDICPIGSICSNQCCGKRCYSICSNPSLSIITTTTLLSSLSSSFKMNKEKCDFRIPCLDDCTPDTCCCYTE